MGSGWFDTILIGLIAGFILFRLWLVLGKRAGHERPPAERYTQLPAEEKNGVGLGAPRPAPVAQPRPAPAGAPSANIPAGTPLAVALAAIRQADRGFDADEFITGARQAHELIATAFAEGDRAALKPLLDAEIYRAFDAAIQERHDKGWKSEFSYVRLKSAEIVDAALQGRTAEVTVRFVSELISGLRDAAGTVVADDPTAVRTVTDVWTFARDTRASDPTWTLVATNAG